MDEHSLDYAFVDSQVGEFEKLALLNPMKWSQAGKGRAIGALATGLLGAGAGAATAPEGERSRGALRGALAGAALGTGAGQLATGQGRRQVGRFLQRQAHGLTGYMPGAYQKEKGILSAFGKGLDPNKRLDILRKMRFSEVPEAKKVDVIRSAAEALEKGDVLQSGLGQAALTKQKGGLISGLLPESVQKQLAGLSARRDIAKLEQAEKGLTAAPQFLRQMVLDPRRTATTGVLAAGGLGTGLTVGMAAPQMYQAAKNKDPEELGASLAETGLYAMSGGLPMLGSMALGSAARRMGGAPGSFYKKMLAKRGKPSAEHEYERVGAGRLVG